MVKRISVMLVPHAVAALRAVVEYGSVAAAARALEISPSAIYRYRKQFPAILEDFIQQRLQEIRVVAADGLLGHVEHLSDPKVIAGSNPVQSVRAAAYLQSLVDPNMNDKSDVADSNSFSGFSVDEFIVKFRSNRYLSELPPAVREALPSATPTAPTSDPQLAQPQPLEVEYAEVEGSDPS